MTQLLKAVSAAALLAVGASVAMAQTTSPTQSPSGTPSQQPQGGADSNAKTVPANPPAAVPPTGTGSGSRPFGQKSEMENQAPAPTKDTKDQKKSPN
jgi:hypothetical protein